MEGLELPWLMGENFMLMYVVCSRMLKYRKLERY
jgi:hypothetical protein